jgi:hypothetical protein
MPCVFLPSSDTYVEPLEPICLSFLVDRSFSLSPYDVAKSVMIIGIYKE